MTSLMTPLDLTSLHSLALNSTTKRPDKQQTAISLDKQNFSVKLLIFSCPSVLTYVLGAQKNRLIETVLLSTHNICFGWEIRKLFAVKA